jgi:hypothetical protein
VGPRAGLDRYGKFAHTGIRSPDLPAHSESLYRLRYLGSQSSSLKTVTITILYYCNKSYIRHPGLHVTQKRLLRTYTSFIKTYKISDFLPHYFNICITESYRSNKIFPHRCIVTIFRFYFCRVFSHVNQYKLTLYKNVFYCLRYNYEIKNSVLKYNCV